MATSAPSKTTAGDILLGLKLDFASFSRQLAGLAGRQTQQTVLGAFKPIGSMIGKALAIGSIAAFTKSCLELGSDLTEVQNVVDTTFPTMSRSVDAWAKSAMKSFGMSETMAKQYIGTLGSMSKSMGFTEKAAFDMSSAVAGLAGDVASFYNLSADEAFNKLKGIWTGESEALKSIGVLMTQTNLDQYALNNGFGKTTVSMTEQEKVMLRYRYVMSSLSDATGDFAKTSGGWANQVRILTLQWQQFKATMGQGFINLFTPILQMVNALIGKLQLLAQKFVVITQLLTGTGNQESSVAKLTQDCTGATKGMGSIEKAAKKAAKATRLLSIDELNKIGSGAATGDLGVEIGAVSDAAVGTSGLLNTVADGMDDFAARVKPYVDVVKDLWEAFKPYAKNFGKGLLDFLKDITGITGVDDIFGENGLFIKLTDALNNGDPETAKKWGHNLGYLLLSVMGFKVAGKAISNLYSLYAVWKFLSKGTETGKAISGVLESLGGLKGILTTDLTTIIGAGTATEIGVTIATGIAGGFMAAIGGFKLGKWLGTKLFPEDKDLYENFTWFGPGGFFTVVGEQIGEWWEDDVAPWFTKEKWATEIRNTKDAFQEEWAATKDWWDNCALVRWFDESVKPWFSKDKWVEAMAGVSLGFAETFRAACNLGAEKVNKFVDWLNEKLNISWDGFSVAGKEIIPKGSFQLFTIPKIPMLADGGYVGPNQPQLAMIGDNRRYGEIVSPEDKMMQVMLDALTQFFARLQASGQQTPAEGDIIIPIYIGQDKIDEMVITAKDRQTLRSGGRG